MNKLILNKPVTMSSREIAELCNKRHFHVMRDIRDILGEAEIDETKFGATYTDSQNREKPCYELPKREAILVVSGYVAKYRLLIIDRWQELETKQAPVIHDPVLQMIITTAQQLDLVKHEQFKQAVKIGDQQQQLDNLLEQHVEVAEQVELDSRRIKKQSKILNQQQQQLDHIKDHIHVTTNYHTVLGYARTHGFKIPYSLAQTFGRKCASLSRKLGIRVGKVADERYEEVGTYHIDILKTVFDDNF